MNRKVVGIAYIKNGKLLTCMSKRSSGQAKYTLIGGGVEAGETAEEAIIRESKEELNFDLDKEDFYKVLSFTEHAASDPSLMIDMDVFVYNKEFDHELETNNEILRFRWYDIKEDSSNLSSSMSVHLIPWAIERGLLYSDNN